MVQKGQFSVEVIDATTKEIFIEHTDFKEEEDDTENPKEKHFVDAFVETEPGSQYFLRVANDSRDSIICNITVDGNDLGYEFCLGPNEYDDKGIWKLENGKSQHTALKVDKVISSSNTVTEGKSDVGVIIVDFFKCIERKGTEKAKDFSSDWNGDKTTVARAQLQEVVDSKRQIKSQQGSHSEILDNDDGRRKLYTYGEGAESIRLKYCTVVGLIAEGVLEKPPLWEWARLTNGPTTKNDTEPVPKIEPKVVQRKTCDDDGKVIEVKDIEMFDLTSLEE